MESCTHDIQLLIQPTLFEDDLNRLTHVSVAFTLAKRSKILDTTEATNPINGHGPVSSKVPRWFGRTVSRQLIFWITTLDWLGFADSLLT